MTKAIQVLHVKELVHEKKGKIFADSLAVAKNFGKEVSKVHRSIEKFKEDVAIFGEMFSEAKYHDDYGREQKMYNMTRDGFSLLVMGFTGKKALEWKLQYMNAFNTMEQIILQKQNVEWIANRNTGKIVRKDLTDTLKQFVEYATAQGSTKANYYYSTITTETYKALKLLEAREAIPSDFRNTLSTFDLSSLTMAEYVAQGAIVEGMVKQMFYKEIYKHAKEKVLIFASSIAIARITKEYTRVA